MEYKNQDDKNLQKNETTTADDKLPVDRGYAWIILLAATAEMAILIGIVKCNGIFFVQFQRRYGSTASMTSLIHTFHNVGYSITSLLVMTVGLKSMSNRTSVMIGSTVYSCCFMITAVAEDFDILYISLGIVNGIAFGFIHPPVIAMIGEYFDKHRGLANSISVVGVSIGGLAFAPLVVVLFEEFSFTGTFLIVSGILFHITICGALLRPIGFYKRSRAKLPKDNNQEADDKTIPLLEENLQDSKAPNFIHGRKLPTAKNKYLLVHQNLFRTASQELPAGNRRKPGEHLLVNDRFRSWSVGNVWRQEIKELQKEGRSGLVESVIKLFDRSPSARVAASDSISASLADLCSTNHVTTKSDEEKSEVPKTISQSRFFDILFQLFDLKMLKKPVFCLFLVCAGLMCVGVALTITFVPPLAKDLQITGSDVALLISINNIIDMISRIVFGIISDRGWVRRSTILGLTAIAMGISSHFVALIHSFRTLLVYGIVIGMFQGVYFALYAVVIVDYLKLENLRSTLGFTVLMQGMFTCASYPIVGALRDRTGSYVVSYHFLGIVLNVSGVLAFLLKPVENWCRKKHERSQKETIL